MKYVVAMKQVPDLQQMRIRDKRAYLVDVPLEFGKIDKNALELAVQLKEEHGGEVVVVSAGNEELSETLKDAMACGGDRASIVADDGVDNLQSAEKAEILAGLIKEIEDPGLIFFAEGSADNYSGQVGSRVAEILGYPQVGFVSSLTIDGNKALATCVLEDSIETLEVDMPAVIIVAGDANTPRLASVIQVLQAGKKPKTVKELDDTVFKVKNHITSLDNLAPDTSRKQQAIQSADQIIELLCSNGIIERRG